MATQRLLDLADRQRGTPFIYATSEGERTVLKQGDVIMRHPNRISFWRGGGGRIYLKTPDGELYEEVKQRFGRATFDEIAHHIAATLGLDLRLDVGTYHEQAYMLIAPQ